VPSVRITSPGPPGARSRPQVSLLGLSCEAGALGVQSGRSTGSLAGAATVDYSPARGSMQPGDAPHRQTSGQRAWRTRSTRGDMTRDPSREPVKNERVREESLRNMRAPGVLLPMGGAEPSSCRDEGGQHDAEAQCEHRTEPDRHVYFAGAGEQSSRWVSAFLRSQEPPRQEPLRHGHIRSLPGAGQLSRVRLRFHLSKASLAFSPACLRLLLV